MSIQFNPGSDRFPNSNPYVDKAIEYQDLERIKFAQELKNRPADYNKLVQDRVSKMTNEILDRKRTAFQKAQIDLGRYMDMDHNANFYKMRNADTERLLQSVAENNIRLKGALEWDKNLTKRQFEINEWYNYNKLETLFFLQLFFMAILGMVVVVYLQKNQTITNALAALLTFFIAGAVIATGVYRYYYTRRVRDTRLWHRRYFGPATPPKPLAKCKPDGSLEFDINEVLPKEFTQCADDAAGRFNSWQDSIQGEMQAFMEKGTAPKRLLGTDVGSAICDNLSSGQSD